MRKLLPASFCLLCCTSLFGAPKSGAAKQKPPATQDAHPLRLLQRQTIKSVPATAFVGTIMCDPGGNLYFRAPNENPALDPVRKVNPKSGDLTTYSASRVPDLTVWSTRYYALDQADNFYQIAAAVTSPDQKIEDIYILKFDEDGAYDSRIKLDILLKPAQLAVFRNGEFLVSGLKVDMNSPQTRPFTGVFSSDGRLLREVTLKDDKKIVELEQKADPSVTGDPLHPALNRAIFLGDAVSGADGNVYLMRRLTPAIIYQISPAGEVTARFEVGSSNPPTPPFAMLASANRLIVQLGVEQQANIFKVLDASSGKELATYVDNDFGGALACYDAETNRFTFLSSNDDGLLEVDTAEPK